MTRGFSRSGSRSRCHRTGHTEQAQEAREGTHWLAPIGPDAVDGLGLGFTGHSARLDADLVDMGGRSYHPGLGRFFSPDPLVISPLDAQAWSRYAYVLNRPLVFTDPSPDASHRVAPTPQALSASFARRPH